MIELIFINHATVVKVSKPPIVSGGLFFIKYFSGSNKCVIIYPYPDEDLSHFYFSPYTEMLNPLIKGGFFLCVKSAA